MNLSESVSNVKGVGEKTIPKLNKLNIYTIGDLIFDLPRGFMELHEPVTNPEEYIGQMIAVKGKVIRGSIHTIQKGKKLTFAQVKIADQSEDRRIRILYFNAPYMAKSFDTDNERIYYGVLSQNGGLTITQPKIYAIEEYMNMLNTLLPVYGLTKGLSNVQLRKYISNAFDIATIPGEYLTEEELIKLDMPHFNKALLDIHFPVDNESHLYARKRLVFHEFLTYFLETHSSEIYASRPFGRNIIQVADTNRLIEALPYRLTDAQLKCWHEVEEDMCSNTCMNRMIQGDVGSGKTIIAFLALLLNAANGHQGCLMAPTEVLASQHYENLVSLVEKYSLPIVPKLLTGSMTPKNKRSIKEGIATGYVNVVIGTQALIQEDVDYRDLTLAITDEQHRFGVRQREYLAKVSDDVHVLVMSATPIPRSLAMTMFSGVKLSVINELPSNRLPIKNCVVGADKRPIAYKFIIDEVNKGHQAYVICPLVEETEGMNLENVIEYCEKLKAVLPENIRIEYLHGKMKAAAKNLIMEEYARHNIDVLVSTTVIEVGINVPNSTVMMIENADRFGLASLHQVRGRVGRGDAQSYCVFIDTGKSEWSKKRLEILNTSNDGFYIAEKDLEFRGPGEVQGIRQSGDFGFVLADIYDDKDVLNLAKEYSDLLFSSEGFRLSQITSAIEEFGFNPVDFATI